VRYVVVGGVAVVLHGVMRFTADLDMVIDLAPEQARTAMDVMTSAGFSPHVPVAASDFEAVWDRATIMQLDTTSVRVASIDDLIAMKRISARPKDLLDIDELEKIRG